MSELDELITKLLKERLGEDAELAIKLYTAYKERGRRGVLEIINEVLREVDVEVSMSED
jgi:hypothetical protein